MPQFLTLKIKEILLKKDNMFNLLSFHQIINHIKHISPNMFHNKGNEINIHCPFCNDATRPNAHSHGHLYLSIKSPVFHCFRCNTSGILISFLLETGFNDEETLNELKKYVKFKFSKDHFYGAKHNIDFTQLYSKINENTRKFQMNYPQDYMYFREYIKNRLGNVVNIDNFLMYPDYLSDSLLSIAFLNSDKLLSCWRNINRKQSSMRYKIHSGNYYFQQKNFDKYKQIVVSEGPFDILNMYLYVNIFKDAFFIAINSSRYIKEVESFIIKYAFIGEYEFNIVFDQNINYKSVIYKLKYLNYLNTNINFRYWLPVLSKDVGEFPKIMELY